MPLLNMLHNAAILARQATSTAAAAATTGAAVAATATLLPSGTGTTPPTTTTPTPTPTSTNKGDDKNGGSSPLLFFVALGFGVVFTNLWIIVGVKYCFRYNARARQMRMANDADPINMEAIPHPRRRRREKKLMSIDDVNEKFPMVKYKTWVASRAKEGLPTRGGVDAPTSRPGSIRSVEVANTDVAGGTPRNDNDAASVETKEKTLTTVQTSGTDDASLLTSPGLPVAGTSTSAVSPDPSSPPPPESATTAESTAARRASVVSDESPFAKDTLMPRTSDEQFHHSDADEEADEHINAALPPECVGTSGDTCAICIDTLDDDDDVRGLSCGHAFHAVCLDPWLTSRRACCPLCKADYYTPRPRGPGPNGSGDAAAAAAAGTGANPGGGALSGNGTQHRMNLPAPPGSAWRGLRGPGRGFPTRFFLAPGSNLGAHSRLRSSPYGGDGPGLEGGATAAGPSVSLPAHDGAAAQPSFLSRIRNAPSALQRWRTQPQSPQQQQSQQGGLDVAGAAAAPSTVTPSQLEAGVRP